MSIDTDIPARATHAKTVAALSRHAVPPTRVFPIDATRTASSLPEHTFPACRPSSAKHTNALTRMFPIDSTIIVTAGYPMYAVATSTGAHHTGAGIAMTERASSSIIGLTTN